MAGAGVWGPGRRAASALAAALLWLVLLLQLHAAAPQATVHREWASGTGEPTPPTSGVSGPPPALHNGCRVPGFLGAQEVGPQRAEAGRDWEAYNLLVHHRPEQTASLPEASFLGLGQRPVTCKAVWGRTARCHRPAWVSAYRDAGLQLPHPLLHAPRLTRCFLSPMKPGGPLSHGPRYFTLGLGVPSHGGPRSHEC